MRKLTAVVVLGISLGLAGCGSSTSTHASPSSTHIKIRTAPTSGVNYHPKIVPTDFTTTVTNRFWPLKPGARWTFDGTKDHVPEHVVVTIARTPKTIMGVKCLIIHDVVTVNGSLEENTYDWYAQNRRTGDIWYFGESVKEYKNGTVISTQGTWEYGVNGAQPGITVKANPRPGPTYRQEYLPGVAEDMAKVLTTSATLKLPAGTFHRVMETYDTDPLNPQKVERKFYAPGVGLVRAIRVGSFHQEEIRLTSYHIP